MRSSHGDRNNMSPINNGFIKSNGADSNGSIPLVTVVERMRMRIIVITALSYFD